MDNAQYRSLLDRIASLEATIMAMKATQEKYVPFVENQYEQLTMIVRQLQRDEAGLARLDEKFESWKKAEIALALSRGQVHATGGGHTAPQPAILSRNRHRSRPRPPWLNVVQVFPLIAGGIGACLMTGLRVARRKGLAMTTAAAVMAAGGAAVAPMITYREMPVHMTIPRASSATAFVSPIPADRDHRSRRRRQPPKPEPKPKPDPAPSSPPPAPSSSPTVPVPTPSLPPVPTPTRPPVPTPRPSPPRHVHTPAQLWRLVCESMPALCGG